MGMTVVEKILAKAAGLDSVKALEVVEPRVSLAMSHENGEVGEGGADALVGPGVEALLPSSRAGEGTGPTGRDFLI